MGGFDEGDDGRDDGREKSFDRFGCGGREEGVGVGLGDDVEELEVGDYHGEDCETLVGGDDEEDSRDCFFTLEIG